MTDPVTLATQSFIGIPGMWLYVITALSAIGLLFVTSFGHASRLVYREEELPEAIGRRRRSVITKVLAEHKYITATTHILIVFLSVLFVLAGKYLLDYVIPAGGIPYPWGTVLDIAILILVLLIIGSILPKVIAYSNPYWVMWFNALPMLWISSVLKPLTFFMVRREGNGNNDRVEITMDELSDVLESTSDHTVEEKKMLSGILEFMGTEVYEIMKPRVDIIGLDIGASFETVIETIISSGFSRIPVYEGTWDNITGILYVKDLLPYISRSDFDWRSLPRKAYFVPETKKINDLLDEFREGQVHMAIIVDEYGSTVGLLSLEDILEEIVGDITDELDVEDKFYTMISPNEYIFDGKTHLNDMLKVLELEDDYLDDIKGEAESVGGLMIEIHRDFLHKGDTVSCLELTLSAEKIDGRRIDKVKVIYKPKKNKLS